MSSFRFNHRTTSHVVLLAGLMVLAANPAFAAPGWEEPIVKLCEAVGTGVGRIGITILGIGLMGYGIYSAFNGEFNLKKVGSMVLGGALCVAAPPMANSLLGVISG